MTMNNKPQTQPFISFRLTFCLLLAVCIGACSFLPDIALMNEPTPTESILTGTPTTTAATPTRRSTMTFRPTPFPTAAEFITEENERIGSEMSGISLVAPAGYEVILDGNVILISGEDMEIYMMGFISAEYAEATHAFSPMAALEAYMEYTLSEETSRIQFHNIHAETVDGNVGNSFDLSGVYGGEEIGGEAMVILRNEQEVLIGFAFSDRHEWQNGSQRVFEDVVSSIDFTNVIPCTIATDPYYGITQDRPIAISGGEMGGSYLEQTYLESLRGPNGIRLQYEYTGTVEHNGQTLDSYSLDYLGLGDPLTIYFDIYSFEQPQAPAGFTCLKDFEFGEYPSEEEDYVPLDEGLNF